MRQDIDHGTVFQKPETLGGDLALLLEAFAQAFRGMSASSRLESHWSRQRHCGCSF